MSNFDSTIFNDLFLHPIDQNYVAIPQNEKNGMKCSSPSTLNKNKKSLNDSFSDHSFEETDFSYKMSRDSSPKRYIHNVSKFSKFFSKTEKFSDYLNDDWEEKLYFHKMKIINKLLILINYLKIMK
jgi:hypothetical protein